MPLLTFEPCMEILHCMNQPECAQIDDLTPYYDRVAEADGIIVATPVMTMGMPGKLKGFMDRFQVFYWAKYGRKEPLVPKERRKQRHGLVLRDLGSLPGSRPNVFEGSVPRPRPLLRHRQRDSRARALRRRHGRQARPCAIPGAARRGVHAMGRRLGEGACGASGAAAR